MYNTLYFKLFGIEYPFTTFGPRSYALVLMLLMGGYSQKFTHFFWLSIEPTLKICYHLVHNNLIIVLYQRTYWKKHANGSTYACMIHYTNLFLNVFSYKRNSHEIFKIFLGSHKLMASRQETQILFSILNWLPFSLQN